MHDKSLNEVVDRLLDDRRFQRRFRRNPERALRPYGLDRERVDALKRGDTQELLALGVRPSAIWPELERSPRSFAVWALQGKRTLVPAVVLLALAAAVPAQASRRNVPGRFMRRRAARAIRRFDGRARGRMLGRYARALGKRAGRVQARARLVARDAPAP